ncbi:unnamed protein product, partial [Acanthoscelides obtectus]
IATDRFAVKDDPIEFGSKNVRLELQQLVKACEHAQVEVLKVIVDLITKHRCQFLDTSSKVLGEFISVQAGSQLAVKVEGVVQHGTQPGLFRKIKEVVVTVTSQLQNTFGASVCSLPNCNSSQ